MKYKIIDCDQHVIEPPDLWEKYLPKKFQEQAPKLVQDEDGGDAWLLGEHVEALGLVAAMHQTPETLKWTGTRYADMHPGITDPKGRLELMDEDGISAAVFFPPQRTMIYFMFLDDSEFSLAGMQAYNNFITDFCSEDPGRLGGARGGPAAERGAPVPSGGRHPRPAPAGSGDRRGTGGPRPRCRSWTARHRTGAG